MIPGGEQEGLVESAFLHPFGSVCDAFQALQATGAAPRSSHCSVSPHTPPQRKLQLFTLYTQTSNKYARTSFWCSMRMTVVPVVSVMCTSQFPTFPLVLDLQYRKKDVVSRDVRSVLAFNASIFSLQFFTSSVKS